MPHRRQPIHIGTSGWSYDHWSGPFYPQGLPNEEWLAFYAEHFSSVEVNNSFYRLPEAGTFRHWRDSVPADFVFSVKASRYITHMKKLKDPENTVPPFMKRARLLGPKLGPVLFQLPPRWRYNGDRLERFLGTLGDGYRYAFEFRDPSWSNEKTYKQLARHNAAYCIFDLDRNTSPKIATADFIYIRLHGPDGPYQGCYDHRTLKAWQRDIRGWVADGKTVFCYFDNDERGYAARNALELQALLDAH